MEALRPEGFSDRFIPRRLVLPDHRAQRLPVPEELHVALEELETMRASGPVFVHCVATMERLPLVCLAWLVSRHGQKPQAALGYMMQVHPGTNPRPGQLQFLEQLR